MDGGEKKEEASLPPDYVSLAQLQERWLRKKQEELELKQKQEEEERREREARARNESNRNPRGPARMAGGFVRETGAVQDKGKGKEIVVARGPGNGEDSDGTRRNNGRRGERKFNGAAVIEIKEKVGVGAEVLSGGGRRRGVEITAGGVGRAGILSREGGSGSGLSGVEVLPRNGEIAEVKRADLSGGGLRGNGRNHSELALALDKENEKGGGKKWLERGRGRNGVNELKLTEPAVNLEEDEGETGRGKKWMGRGRNGVNELKHSEPKINSKEGGENGAGVVDDWELIEPAISLKKGRKKGLGGKWQGKRRERGRNGVNELKESELEINLKEGEGVEKGSGGVNELKQSEPAMNLEESEKGQNKKWKHSGRGRERNGMNELKQSELRTDLEKEKEGENNWKGKGKGKGRGRNGVDELKQSEVALDLEKEEEIEKGRGKKWKGVGKGRNGVDELKQSEVAPDLEKEEEVKKGHGKKWRGSGGNGRGRGRGRNGVNELNQSEVALDLEKEEEVEKGHGKKWRGDGRGKGRGRNGVNELKQSEVALDLEVEEEEEGETGGGKKLRGRGRPGRFLERINRLKDMPVIIEGNEVDSELKNKAEDEISDVCSEITSLSVGDTNGIPGQDNKAEDDDDGVEGEGSNGLKVALEIEKKVDHEILARKSESWGYEREYPRNGNRGGGFGREYLRNGIRRGGFGREYPGNGNWKGRFGRGWRYTSSQISDRMNSTEIVQVWVKKEDKLDA